MPRLGALVSGLSSKAIATCDKPETFNVVPSRNNDDDNTRNQVRTTTMAGLTHRQIRYGAASELQEVDVWELPENERKAAASSDRYWFM